MKGENGSTGSSRTYPKSSAHPSCAVGNCKQKDGWPSNNTVHYPGGGPSATIEETERAKTLHCSGGSGSPSVNSYPPKRTSFGTEKHVGVT